MECPCCSSSPNEEKKKKKKKYEENDGPSVLFNVHYAMVYGYRIVSTYNGAFFFHQCTLPFKNVYLLLHLRKKRPYPLFIRT